MHRRSLFLILIASALFGCGAYPVTDGFQKALPERQARIVVWGGNLTANAAVTTWLQKLGLTIIERARVQQVFAEQRIVLTNTPYDDAQMLRVGKLIGLDQIVYVDVSAVEVGTIRPLFNPPITTYIANVAVRGVRVETGEVVWSGTARYRNPIMGHDDYVVRLSCQALATAWGLRPPGELPVASQAMCAVGDRDEIGGPSFP